MLIYRVEDAETKMGPYRGQVVEHPKDPINHPSPLADCELAWDWAILSSQFGNPQHLYRFAFESMSALRTWFHDANWLLVAHASGLHVGVYEVDDQKWVYYDGTRDDRLHLRERAFPSVIRGDKQLVFWTKAAKLIKSVALTAV